MIKNTLIVVLLLLVAWMSRDYFSITLPSPIDYSEVSQKVETVEKPSKPKSSIEIVKTQNAAVKKAIHTPVQKSIKSKQINPLDKLLAQHKFYDALTYYLEHSTQANIRKIEQYLKGLAESHPSLALEYMQVFLDNVPDSNTLKLMIVTHLKQKNYETAITLMIQAKDNYVSEEADKNLASKIKDTSVTYIDMLMKNKSYGKLIAFLETMIDYDDQEHFYPFQLAQVYILLDKVDEAREMLVGLEYDEVYAQNVKTMLSTIDIEEDVSYEYIIPLSKYGDHYVVNTVLDGTSFRLMLDTGATYIYIDEDKASMLEIIKSNLRLRTAGGDVEANLRQAASMKIGDLELSDIKVTTAPFKREGIDGLLGMNFFKQFEFFINQNEDTLYLNPK